MKEQKNIDRLFQEKFKDFEMAPPEMAWKNIEARLKEKKKKRRVIPFWLKTSGIAASLLLGFYTFTLFNAEDRVQSEQKTVETNKIDNNQTINKKDIDSSIKPSSLNIPDKSILTENGSLDEPNQNNTLKNNSKSLEFNKPLNSTNSQNKLVKNNKSFQNKSTKNTSQSNKLFDIEKEELFVTKNENHNSNSNLTFQNLNKKENNGLIQEKNNSNRSVVILEKSNANITQDSSIVAAISEEISTLEQLLKEKEAGKNAEEKEKRDKWGVSTNAAPVYFNSTTNGSPINTQFSENSKSYASTISYGVGINYTITEKLSLRTGINSLTLEYNTNDVSYSTTLRNSPSDGSMLSRNSNGQNVVFFNNNIENKATLSSDVENFVQNNIGKLNQTTSYYEIPVELSYKLIDKRFGLEFIGGMSSLFLNQNSISLLSEGMEMEIGEANNLSKVHFSSNIGLGFKYSLLKSFEVNFNPMFKYQLNTYTDNSGNFKPYFIGLYSGLSYKF